MGADRITSGPLTAAGTNPYDQKGLVLDKQNNILETCGDSHVLAACQTALSVLNAQTAITAVTAAQNLINMNINAGALNKLTRTVRVRGRAVYTTPGTTTPVLTIALLVAGVSVCSIATAALSSTASTNMPFDFDFQFTVASTGAAGTLEAHGKLNANITANTPAAALASYADTNTAVSSAVNLVAAGTIKVQASANSAITSIQLRNATIEIVN